MFRHVLVPLDGSLRAERAIFVAARLARASEGILILLRIVKDAPEDGPKTSVGSPLFQAAIQSEREEAQQYLTGIASSHQLAGLPIIVSTAHGPVATAIQVTIDTYEADLLVCCEQPEPRGSQQFLGSFAEQLSQRLSIPLLLLPAQEPLHGSLAEIQRPLTCLIGFAGAQPEPFLIQPAVSLLAAFSSQEPGRLHFVPLRSLLSRSARTPLEPQAPAPDAGQLQVSRRSAVLLKEVRLAAKPEDSSVDVFILATPLPSEDGDVLREMRAYPRLLLPSQVRGSQKISPV